MMTADEIAITEVYVIEALTIEGALGTRTWKFLDIEETLDAAKKRVDDFNFYKGNTKEVGKPLSLRYTKELITKKEKDALSLKKIVNDIKNGYCAPPFSPKYRFYNAGSVVYHPSVFSFSRYFMNSDDI